MRIESITTTYPSRMEYSPVVRRPVERPDYDFPIIEIQWFDASGEHITPASQALLDRAVADKKTDQALLDELRTALAALSQTPA